MYHSFLERFGDQVGVKKGCRDDHDVVSSEDTEDTVKIRGAGPIEGDEKVDRRGRVDRRGGPSGARTGKVSTLSSAHLREVARRPTACSLEHRARARFDEEHLLAVGELESATAALQLHWGSPAYSTSCVRRETVSKNETGFHGFPLDETGFQGCF